MQSEEQRLIDDLFARLQKTEHQAGPRDANAEQIISKHLQTQPAAPYYMSQALLIQEAALKKLNARVNELESQKAQTQPSKGGFLSGLFGDNSSKSQAIPGQGGGNSNQYSANSTPQQSNQAPVGAGRSSSFLGGALQTAAGVAGGVVLGNMLTSMFSHAQPQEIVNIINEPPLEQPDYDTNLDTFNHGDNGFLSQSENNNWNDSAVDNQDTGSFFDNSGFDDDDSFF